MLKLITSSRMSRARLRARHRHRRRARVRLATTNTASDAEAHRSWPSADAGADARAVGVARHPRRGRRSPRTPETTGPPDAFLYFGSVHTRCPKPCTLNRKAGTLCPTPSTLEFAPQPYTRKT